MDEEGPLLADRKVSVWKRLKVYHYLFAIALVLVIFAATALIIAYVVLQDTPEDTEAYILFNGKIYSPRRNGNEVVVDQFDSFIVKNGKFVKVGSYEQFLKSDSHIKKRIDADGKTIIPGFIDAHAHMSSLGKSLSEADLMGSKSPGEVVERLLPFSEGKQKGEWLTARGWDQQLFPSQQYPNRQDLDEAFPNIPVWLRRTDGHAAWANSATLESIGPLPADDPEGGKIIRDKDGKPTGIFVDNAMSLIDIYVPPTSFKQEKEHLTAAVTRCNELGITGVHDAGVGDRTLNVMRQLIDEDNFNMRIYAMVLTSLENHEPNTSIPLIDEWCRRGYLFHQDKLTVRSTKLFMDGALGSRGAALLAPYSDDENNTGLLVSPLGVYAEAVEQWMACDFQVNTHAIGDRANRLVLDTYEDVIRGADKVGEDLRWRVEHSQFVTPEDRLRFKDLHLIASMQPTHATSDMHFAEDRVGNRTEYGYSWRSFADLNVTLSFGSDFPVERVNPLLGFYASITRQTTDGEPPDGWYPEQRISRMETLYAFTVGAAFASFQENELGQIKENFFADFIVLSEDIMEIPPAEILETKVLSTYVGGKKVF